MPEGVARLKLLQELDEFAVERVVERICFLDGVLLVAFEVVSAFSANVHAENFVACGKGCDAFFECVER